MSVLSKAIKIGTAVVVLGPESTQALRSKKFGPGDDFNVDDAWHGTRDSIMYLVEKDCRGTINKAAEQQIKDVQKDFEDVANIDVDTLDGAKLIKRIEELTKGMRKLNGIICADRRAPRPRVTQYSGAKLTDIDDSRVKKFIVVDNKTHRIPLRYKQEEAVYEDTDTGKRYTVEELKKQQQQGLVEIDVAQKAKRLYDDQGTKYEELKISAMLKYIKVSGYSMVPDLDKEHLTAVEKEYKRIRMLEASVKISTSSKRIKK